MFFMNELNILRLIVTLSITIFFSAHCSFISLRLIISLRTSIFTKSHPRGLFLVVVLSHSTLSLRGVVQLYVLHCIMAPHWFIVCAARIAGLYM